MNYPKTHALCAAIAVLLAGCGGGDTAVGDAVAPTLTLSGTAATGLALADSPVAAKCASGSAETTTAADGGYQLTIPAGALPCVLQVSGSADGVAVVLHSVADAGSSDGAATTAVANITPLTEMVLAQMAGTMPSELFDNFDAAAAQQITPQAVSSASQQVVTALKDATGIDLGSIDPFKAPLVAATPSAPTAGNQYDQLLDALKLKVSTEALPLVVNQIAAAAAAGTEASAPTLADVMTGVERGSLDGCPVAISGRYRMIDYWGRSLVRELDFKNNKFNRGDGQLFLDIVPHATQACEFRASGQVDGDTIEYDVVFGPAGAGAYVSRNVTQGRSTIGYIFPVQKHALSTVVGTWSFMQSGFMPGDGVQHYLGQISFAANGAVSFCDYVPASDWACVAEPDVNETITEGPDHGFRINDGGEPAPMYAYRAPNGSVTLFGSTNPSGANTQSTEQTSFIAYKPAPVVLPQVGTVTKYWDIVQLRLPIGGGAFQNTTDFQRDANTVTAVDTVARTFSRQRASDGRPDTLLADKPVEGMRRRVATTWDDNGTTRTISGMVSISLPGLGMALGVSDGSGTHFLSVSPVRP
ncbi:MAG TPA: hypothetical protein VM406_00635 [Noviherbaspirillum sp.]|nr:hypothetical protein [Noviherbaspirillum sp.]